MQKGRVSPYFFYLTTRNLLASCCCSAAVSRRSSTKYRECSSGMTVFSTARWFLAFHFGPPRVLLSSEYLVNSEPNCRPNWLLGWRGGAGKGTEGGCSPGTDDWNHLCNSPKRLPSLQAGILGSPLNSGIVCLLAELPSCWHPLKPSERNIW